MNFSPSLESVNKTFSQNPSPEPEMVPRGNPELVNFSSTGEVFQAVFENSCHANMIGNGHGNTLQANETVCEIFGYKNDK